MDRDLVRAYAAELIGTFALVFLGAGTVCVNSMTDVPQMRPGLVGIALANGLILAAGLAITVPISGGYLNPAVTLMLWCFNQLTTARMAWYVGGQVLGAVLAGLCLYFLFDLRVLQDSHVGTPHLNLEAFGLKDQGPTMPAVVTGTGIELVLTFFLVFAIFGSMRDPRGPRHSALVVGLTLAANTFFGFALTGAACNPARWFGTVFWERLVEEPTVSPFADAFVYVAGPIVGALLAGVVFYKLIPPTERAEGATEAPAAAGDKGPALGMAGKVKK